MTEISESILAKLNSEPSFNCFDDKYFTKSKLAHSGYFVDQVRWEIGRISFFDLDHELTQAEEDEIVAAFFA